VQSRRDIPDHHVADEARQDEDGEVREERGRCEGTDQPEQQRANDEDDGKTLARAGSPAPWPDFLAGDAGAAAGFACGAAAGSLGGGGGHVMAPSLTTVRPRRASSSMLTLMTPVLRLAEFLGQAQQVRGVQRRRLLGQTAGEIRVADDGDAVPHDGLAGFGQLAVAALFGRPCRR